MTRVTLIGGGEEITAAVAGALERRTGLACDTLDASEGLSGLGDRSVADVVVYLGVVLGRGGGPPETERAEEVFRVLAETDVARLIVVSSASVTPARHVHPGHVGETRRPVRGVNSVADLWAGFEVCAGKWLAGRELMILRPASTSTRSGGDILSRMLRSSFATTFAGHDPSIQLLAVEDLAAAVVCAVEAEGSGVLQIAPAGVVPLHTALRLAGTRRVPLPRWLHRLGRWALGSLGVPSLAEADRLRYSATISGRKAREVLGFVPRIGSGEVAAGFGDEVGGDSEGGHEPIEYDDFGKDDRYTARMHRTVLGFLHDRWWRVELDGTENVPREGAAVLVGVHRGFMPYDGSMAILGLLRETGRHPRFLVHPTLVKQPFLCDFITRQGGIIACRENAERVLRRGGLLGVFPEGIEGAFAYYREAYRLRRDFGRDEFVKTALRNRAPIVPFVTVGSPEIFPILAKIDWRWWIRFSEWPCFPIAPPFPLLPMPLPSKWHTKFLEPLPVQEEYPPEAAGDPEVVRAISARVRGRMEAAFADMLARRKSIFFGSIFDRETPPEGAP